MKKAWFIFTVLFLCGCSRGENNLPAEDTMRIALIGEASFLESGGSMDGMNLAVKEFEKEHGSRIEIEVYDDKSNYNEGVTLAEKIAGDPGISVTISKQELDILDAVAGIFEEKEKPLIITNGCYDRTADQGYQYVLMDFINAETAGKKMGEYAISKNYKTVAYCHSDTEYEKDELKGVESALKESGVSIADVRVGPYSREEFEEAYEEWEMLGVEAVYVSIYYLNYGSDIVRMLREKGSDIQVISDYAMDNDVDIERNGKYLEGTVIAPLYAYKENDAFKECDSNFYRQYGYHMTSQSLQSYELIRMIGECFLKKAGNLRRVYPGNEKGRWFFRRFRDDPLS